jgi:hypothetical protein
MLLEVVVVVGVVLEMIGRKVGNVKDDSFDRALSI